MNGSLGLSPNFVEDAFKALSAITYEPEKIALGRFTFLPWVRTGLAAVLEPPAPGKLRATVTVSVDVQEDGAAPIPVKKTLTLRGPGDVIGLEGAQIVRRVPQPGAINVEDTFMAHVEFDRPELPWLFTPFAPGPDERLMPWLVLVVCDAALSTLEPGPPGFPQRLRTRLGELQPLEDAWAFAHAQVVGDSTGEDIADRLDDSHGPTNLSRIVCPRRLLSERSYLAALVPAFDCGRQIGLGLPGGTLGPAWTRAADGSAAMAEIVLPIYDSWGFSTAKYGDFESLAKKIHGVLAPWNIGKRVIDASDPRGDLPPLGPDDPGRVQVLRCALFSKTPAPPDAPSESNPWNAAARTLLRDEVDKPGQAADAADLPRVGPRLYGKFQRGSPTTGGAVFDNPEKDPDQDWFTQLNTDPMHRIVGGLGTRVVQRDQEPLMQSAWAQVGDIKQVNQTLARMQFGRYVGEALHRQHYGRLPLGPLAQSLRGVQGKIRHETESLTVYGVVERSATAQAALSASFRRMTRARGPLARFGAMKGLGELVAGPQGFKDLRREYAEPDGIVGLSAQALQCLERATIDRLLGTDSVALDRLSPQVQRVNVADRMLEPLSNWNIPAGNIDLGAIAAVNVAARIDEAMPDAGQADALRANALAPLLVGLAGSGVERVSHSAVDRIGVIHARLPSDQGGVTLPAGGIHVTPGASLPGVGAGHVTLPGQVVGGRLSSGGMRSPAVRSTEANASLRTPAGSAQVRLGATAAASRPLSIDPGTMVNAELIRPDTVFIPQGPVTVHVEPPAAALTPAQRFETDTSRVLARSVSASRAVAYADAAAALQSMVLETGVQALPKTPDRPALTLGRETLLSAVAPSRTVTAYAKSRLARMPDWLPKDWFDDLRIAPIMAAPRFDRPMFEALDAYDREWLVPGLGSIPFTDFATVLFTNPAFTESFLVGLSDEMGRELLWRGYPTDQRGTYFWRFWQPDVDELTKPIHRFSATRLGTHVGEGNPDDSFAALVVRGELVRRYPHLVAYAIRAMPDMDDAGRPRFIDPSDDSHPLAEILFHDHLQPDVLLVGFKLTKSQLLDPNARWWFILAEHPTGPRFGFDAPDDKPLGATVSRNDLDWDDMGPVAHGGFVRADDRRQIVITDPDDVPKQVVWPGTSAIVARVLLQNPIRAAFQASALLAPAAD